MKKQASRGDLITAVKIIKQWHDAAHPTYDSGRFRIYYEKSPEMKTIREVLGAYDEMADEVISATSISVSEK